jgi:E3 ubiquitin-protein ligase EDD1
LLVLCIFLTFFTASVFVERQKRPAPKGDDTEKKDEEEWQLKDVVFVEDVKSVPVGMSYS